jgi:hypothetical protein
MRTDRLLERAEELVDRRRLVVGLCIAVGIALVAAIPGLRGGGEERSLRTASAPTTVNETSSATVDPSVSLPAPQDPTATTVPPAASTTRPPSVLGVTFTLRPTTTTARPRPATAAPPNTAAPTAPPPANPGCRNSYDPACGPFRWDPDPGPNQALAGDVTTSPESPRAGEKVTFTITGSDLDASPVGVCNYSFGDGPDVVCDPRPAMDPSYCPKQYGAWNPPPREEGRLNTALQHTYPRPGTYQVSFDLRSAMDKCNNPYASGAIVKTTVIIGP